MNNVPDSPFAPTGVFGRLFPTLPSYRFGEAPLIKLGATSDLMRDPAGDAPEGDSTTIPTGMTFFGQFIDHDITFDPTSSLERQNDPEAIHNFRTPLLELDSVYGAGPEASPYLYARPPRGQPTTRLLLGLNDQGEANDLPRNPEGVALIGDPRNDENLLISQMHMAFLKFHNRVVDLMQDSVPPEQLFEEAQRAVRWHYQWIIVHEFLPQLVEQSLIDTILRDGPRFYRPDSDPFIPIEFAVAAFRFGHSQIRNRYRINANVNANLFPLDANDNHALSRGFSPVPAARVVDWRHLFAIDAGVQPQMSRKLDERVAEVVFQLPFVNDPRPERRALPALNLLRSEAFSLPWGQRVARALGFEPLNDQELGLKELGFPAGRAPLWFYILRESGLQTGGERLGSTGATIVAEVLLGLLKYDYKSYLAHDPDWQPFLPRRSAATFTMADLLLFAGVASTAPQPQIYTVQPGDSLRMIARHVYGDEQRWRAIFEANKDKIADPDLIFPGQQLVIPV
jgi:hypothetical protein